VLGVPPTADEQEIKRGYARQVRAHPPETDPEGFQRITEAFELLRDPVQRARIATEVAEPELGRLRSQYVAARQAEDLQRAAEVLKEIIDRFPQHRDARDEQVRFLAGIGRTADAIVAVEALVADHPSHVEPLLLAADVYASTYEYVKARGAVERARALAPEDRRPLLALSRMSAQMEKLAEAAGLLQSALALPDKRFVSDTELIGRRILLLSEAHMLESAQQEIDKLVASCGTAEERRATAGLLTSLAGYVLANGKAQRVSIASQLFEKANHLDPERHRFKLDRQREAPIDRLDGASQRHVDDMRAGQPEHLAPSPRASGLFAGVLALAGWILVVIVGVGAVLPGPFTATQGVLGMVGLGLVGGYFAVRPPKTFDYLELRPLHLLRVRGSRVLIVPLLRVVKIVPMARSASLMLDGGEEVLIETTGAIAPFLQAAVQQAERLSQLAMDDLLETELEREPLQWDPV